MENNIKKLNIRDFAALFLALKARTQPNLGDTIYLTPKTMWSINELFNLSDADKNKMFKCNTLLFCREKVLPEVAKINELLEIITDQYSKDNKDVPHVMHYNPIGLSQAFQRVMANNSIPNAYDTNNGIATSLKINIPTMNKILDQYDINDLNAMCSIVKFVNYLEKEDQYNYVGEKTRIKAKTFTLHKI